MYIIIRCNTYIKECNIILKDGKSITNYEYISDIYIIIFLTDTLR